MIGIYGVVVEAMVEMLLSRGGRDDVAAAQAAMTKLSRRTVEPQIVLNRLLLLRLDALLAGARGDRQRCHESAERYRALAIEYGYEAHIAKAEAMS
ncbi:hypothetical protein [Mycobacterium sp. 1274761.0]|uniref:hypothetical protein n=1 Tax=Mycobacterium sp. 1274761.0 TaxID=1834077 RepID=UPI0007FE61B1|nr:hypothetical protein [Mycobacterium sp. 1274761.0]OBK74979.1 hypothetical protein A5651_08885 [Mycobacterium sp. 1274761.0]